MLPEMWWLGLGVRVREQGQGEEQVFLVVCELLEL